MKHLEKHPKNVVFCICSALLLVFPTSCGQAVTPDAPTQALEFVFSRSADSSVNPKDIPAALLVKSMWIANPDELTLAIGAN